jgi:glycosyl hydrolase family 44
MNFAPARLESQLKLPVVRWGGNATTRYNYLLDTANHASDWYFENIPNTVKNPAALPGGSTADQFIGQNKRDGADSIITVPLIGALDKIDGGLAGADVLGIFGREGLDLATLWGPPAFSDPGAFAFRMYLDYNGKGSGFGDTGVHAVSSAQTTLAIYAAQRSSDGAQTAIVINKTHHAVASPLTVTGLAAHATAEVFRYGQADPTAIVHEPARAFSNGSATVTLPADSITEFVVPASGLAPAVAQSPPRDLHGHPQRAGAHGPAWPGGRVPAGDRVRRQEGRLEPEGLGPARGAAGLGTPGRGGLAAGGARGRRRPRRPPSCRPQPDR